MKTHYSIAELLDMKLDSLPETKVGLGDKAKRENWPYIEVAGKGGRNGKRREYTPPPEVMAQIRERQTEKVLAELPPVPAVVPSGTAVSTEMRRLRRC